MAVDNDAGTTNPPQHAGETSQTQKPQGQQPNEGPQIESVVEDLLTDIYSVRSSILTALHGMADNIATKATAYKTFLADHAETRDGKLAVPVDKSLEYNRILQDLKVSAGGMQLVLEGLFLVLVSKWDAYLGNLLRWLFAVIPNIIDKSGRTIPFSDLSQIPSISDARAKIVEDEISALLREGHVEQIDYLKKKAGVTLTHDKPLWISFVEIIQRRHLIAHTNGKVSDQYLKVCSKQGVASDKLIAIGEDIKIGPAYLRCST